MAEALGPWALVTPQLLSRFLERNVRIPREDTSEVFAGAVLPAVGGILQGVHGLDKRFSSSFLRSGSYIEGLKVSEPDEFDFLVPLQCLPVLQLSSWAGVSLPAPPPDGAFVAVLFQGDSSVGLEDVSLALCQDEIEKQFWLSFNLRAPYRLLTDPSVHAYTLCGARLLSPDKFMGIFKKLVCDVTQSLKDGVSGCEQPSKSQTMHCSVITSGSIKVYRRKKESPAVTLKILFKENEIDVDLVPLIKKPYQSWTFNWPRSGQSWPLQEKIQEVKETGVDLVAKHEYYWRYSFSRIEKVLFEKIDEDDGQRRNSLRILKKVREDLWKPKFGKVLVSYHLKTILFWACEKYPNSNDWQDLAQSFRRLVGLLTDYLSSGNLPHYFLGAGVNLLKAPRDDLNAVCAEVLKFQEESLKYFQKRMPKD